MKRGSARQKQVGHAAPGALRPPIPRLARHKRRANYRPLSAEELIGRARGLFVERTQQVEIDFDNLTPGQQKKAQAWLEEQAFKDDPAGLGEWRKGEPKLDEC